MGMGVGIDIDIDIDIDGLEKQLREGAAASAICRAPKWRALGCSPYIYISLTERGPCSRVASCFWPALACNSNQVVVPSLVRAPDVPVGGHSKPRSPFEQAVAPTPVSAQSSLACGIKFPRPLQQYPIRSTMLSGEILAYMCCSLDVVGPLLQGQSWDTDDPSQHPSFRGGQLPFHVFGQSP